jgi:hypothetical protein
VSDSPVPVAKIDTACKSNISILKKNHENVGIDMIESISITPWLGKANCPF